MRENYGIPRKMPFYNNLREWWYKLAHPERKWRRNE